MTRLKSASQHILESLKTDDSKIKMVLSRLYDPILGSYGFCPVKSGIEEKDDEKFLVLYDLEFDEIESIDILLSNIYNQGVDIKLDEYSLNTVSKKLVVPIEEPEQDDYYL